jgi:parallel beta-helix repeat protein
LRKSLLLLALLGSFPLLPACSQYAEFPDYVVVSLAPGPDLEFRAREALATAQPGTLIEFPAGNWEFTDELVLTTSHVTLRGQGPDQTTLDFTNQQTGGQGILATGDAFAIQDLRVLNPKGDGVRVEGADGVTFQNLHVVWSGEPRKENGAYGIYPVLSQNVLVEGCYVRGSSDAGIYVGQSEGVIVRWSKAEGNVAGIEIENTKDADVYLNSAVDNTGGLLVFDGSGLQRDGCRVYPGAEDPPGCKGTRVFFNYVANNNRANFASGGTVALVPRGTGFLILSTDKIEVFGNVFRDNGSSNVIVVTSELLREFAGLSYGNDLDFDPWTEHIDVHHNVIVNGGFAPDPNHQLVQVVAALFSAHGTDIPQILFDGYVDPAKTDATGKLLPELQICLDDNFDDAGQPTLYGDFDRIFGGNGVTTDIADVAGGGVRSRVCDLPQREPTVLAAFSPTPEVDPPYTPEEIEALCDAGAPIASGPNFAAGIVDCPRLSDYRLFLDPTEPTASPNGGIPFDITTPLFSDYALKDRFLFVPPGQQVVYSANGDFDFPIGTIIAKSFSIAHDLRDPGLGAELIETRLLIRRPDGWRGTAYIWNEARTEATLALGGGAADVAWIHSDGSARETRYHIPNTGQCLRCHTSASDGAVPIGPKARLLNRPLDYGAGVGELNQLTRWSDLGLLVGAPVDPATAPRLPVWNDPSDGTLEQRAKAYLESNCAHCHRPGGAARQSGLYLEASRQVNSQYGVCKGPVSAGPGAGGLAYDLVPGDPDASIIVFRMLHNEAQIKMPELSRSVVHEEGVALVSDWIASLPGSCQ